MSVVPAQSESLNPFDPTLQTPAANTQARDLVQLLRQRAIQTPDKTAYIYLSDGDSESDRFSYAELDQRARAIAAGLQARGRAGDRVLLLYPACAEFIPAFFGCLYAGMIAVPAYLPKQNRHRSRLDAIVEDAGARLVLTENAHLGLLQGQASDAGPLSRALCLASDDMLVSDDWSAPEIGAASIAFLQYTSGSTGKPKGVMVSHGNVLHNQSLMAEAFRLDGDSVFVSWLPTFHDMGLILGMLQPLYGGFLGVLMPPNAFLQKPVRWLRALSRYGGTATAAPNFAYDLCVEKIPVDELQGLNLGSWRSAINGAEPVRWATLQRFVERFQGHGFRADAFLPAYGMAEGTLYISGGLAGAPRALWLRGEALEGLRAVSTEEGQRGAKALVPCGRALGQRMRIVDLQTQALAAPGQIGEIWVQGPSVAQGYWGDEAATLGAFGATLDGEGGAFLRTGDLGFEHEGQVVIAGRLKDLIIVRGVNYFPQDLEASMQGVSPDLRAGCGAAFSIEQSGEERLVLVQELVRHPQSPLTATLEAIRKTVLRQQGLGVWALVLVRAGSIAKTSSGKIQRRACREAFLKGQLDVVQAWTAAWQEPSAAREAGAVPLSGRWKAFCCRLVEQGIAVPEGLSARSRLGELGLDSLQVAELQAWVSDSLKLELALERFYEDLSLAELLQLDFSSARVSMTPLQESFYLARQAGEPACSILVELQLLEAGTLQLWQSRLDRLIARHQALRLGAVEDGGALFLDEGAFVAPRPLSCRPLADAAEAAQALGALAADPAWCSPFEAVLLEGPTGPARLLLLFDHLYVDGLSLRGLLAELGAVVVDEALPQPYLVGRKKMLEALAPSKFEADRSHWSQRLRNSEALTELPPGFEGQPGAGAAAHRQSLEPGLCRRLESLAKRDGVSLFAVYVAAFSKLWAFWLRQEEIVFNTPVAGRPVGESPAWVGCYADIVPLAMRGSGETAWPELTRLAQAALLEAQRHATASAVLVARDLAKERGQRPQTLSPLTITSGLFLDWSAGPLPISAFKTHSPATWLDLCIFKQGDGVVLAWNYDASRIKAERLQRLARQMALLLKLMVEKPEADAFSELLEAEDLGLHAGLNAGQQAAAAPGNLVRLFRDAAAAHPEARALTDGSRHWSYHELDAASEALAWRLQAAGAGPGKLVALCLERSAEVVLGILGILKAGAAYLPLDPVYPSARLAFILEDAEPTLLLTQASLAERFSSSILTRLELDQALEATGLQPDRLPSEPGPQEPAYVIYTSGSTGSPKGVVIRHGEVARLMSSTQPWFQFNATDVWTLFHSYAFDFSVWEIWGALLYGGRLVVVPAALSRDPGAFYDLCRHEGVSVLNQTPAAFDAFMAAEQGRPADGLIASLRWIVFGGEALDLAALKTWYAQHPDSSPRLVNMYGITETTVHVTYRHLSVADAEANQGSLIGVPIPDLQLYVLDTALRPVPMGVAGELFVGGAGLAQGYLKRPELNEQRFIQNSRGRLYRSGDLARFLPSGELSYVGRSDQQVKIRGFRLELGEVAAKIRALPGVQDVAVVALEARPGDKRLVAYFVAKAGSASLDPGSLRAALAADLPDYMVPAAMVELPALPLTENGKLDRKRLPAPRWGEAQTRVLAADAIEASLLVLWERLLGVENAGVEDDLFAAGGHSLTAARLLALAGQAHDCRLALGPFVARPTVRALAEQVRQAKGCVACAADADLAQESESSLWALQQSQPRSSSLNVAWALWHPGPLEDGFMAELRRALEAVQARHPALRTGFEWVEGRLIRKVLSTAPLRFEILEPCAERGKALEAAARWAGKAFDLAGAPLWRTAIIDTPQGQVIAFNGHHIILDLRSVELICADLGRAWGASESLPSAPTVFAAALDASQRPALTMHWQAALKGYDDSPFFLAERATSGRARHFSRAWGPEQRDTMQAYCRSHGSTPFQVLLCAWQLALMKLVGRKDVCVGSPVSSRQSSAEMDSVGYFTNLVPFRLALQGGESGAEALRLSQIAWRQSLAGSVLPLASLLQCLPLKRQTGQQPLFQCAFIHQESALSPVRLGGMDCEQMSLPASEVKLGLALVVEEGPQPRWRLELAEGLLRDDEAEGLFDAFGQALERLLVEPQSIWDSEDSHAAQRDHVASLAKTVVQLFADQCHAEHAAPALRLNDGQELSYGALGQQARCVAGRLQALGIATGHAVGVHASAGAPWVASVLGILEAGAVYVPLDPAYPVDRLRRMVRSAGVKVVLGDRPWPVEDGIPCVDMEEACRWQPPMLRQPHEPQPHDAAYIIFTSGSSGEPKGVLVEHGALANHAIAYAKSLSLGAGDTVMQFVPISFDASLEELFPTLCAGACLALPQPKRAMSAEECTEAMARLGVSIAHFPAAYWHAWAPAFDRASRARLPKLRALVTGGEAPDPGVLKRFLQVADPLDYFNAYGPTEAAITSFLWHRPAGTPLPDKVPLGRPLAGVRYSIVTEDGAAAGTDELGELWISGLGLARAYVGDPNLTQARFVQGQGQRRHYRSGDLVRKSADGQLVYAGRRDAQVKISGHRVELGEIESSLRSAPGVGDGAVRLEQHGSGAQIWAWAVPQAGLRLEEGALRRWLSERLPAALVPARVWMVDALPMTPNGKLDRAALRSGDGDADSPASAPSGLLSALVGAWADCLRRPGVNADSDFFALGGSSLMAVALATKVGELTGKKLSLDSIYAAPTPRAFLKSYEADPSGLGPLACLRKEFGGFPLLWLHPIGGQIACYRQLTDALSGAGPVFAIQAEEPEGSAARSLQDLAEHYSDLLESAKLEGPWVLAGWSMGGLLACEMERVMNARGRSVGLLALIDTVMPDPVEGALLQADEELCRCVFNRDMQARGLDPRQGESLYPAFRSMAISLHSYRPQVLNTPLALMVSEATLREAKRDPLHDWARLAAEGLTYKVLPGDHYSIMQGPAVQMAAAFISQQARKAWSLMPQAPGSGAERQAMA